MHRNEKDIHTPSQYLIHYDSKNIEIINTKTQGSLTFNIQGEDELKGHYSLNTIYKGGRLIRKVDSEHRTMFISFEIPLDHNALIIEVSNFYKANCEVENDGIIGLVNGNLEFIKDENVFIEGNPTMAGFTDENKTKFILAPNYGELTSHWDIVENKYYKGIDIQKGHENHAKFIVFSNNESPIRMLCQPHGYNATFTIASHADRSNVNVTKAVFYGSNLEKSPDYKKKGLIGYGIKGTLSVFAAAEDLKYTKNNLVPEMKSWLYSILKGNLKKQTHSFLTFIQV